MNTQLNAQLAAVLHAEHEEADLEAELDTQAAAQPVGDAQPGPAEPKLGLAELLKRAVKKQLEDAAYKASRDRLKKGGSNQFLAEDIARIAHWEAENEWSPEATVAVFERTMCECCKSTTRAFQGVLQRQVSKINRYSRRWTTVQTHDPKLPRVVGYRTRKVDWCAECITEAGFSVDPLAVDIID